MRRTRIFPLDGGNVLQAEKASNYDKTVQGQSGGKREKTSWKYISSRDVQRLKGSRKDCKMNVQARCGEKSRTDKSFSLFPLQNKRVTNIPTTKPRKKTFAEISQRMFSEMFAFTEVAEMKTSATSALYLQSNQGALIKCSRGALSISDKIENWKNTKKKILPSMRRRKLKWRFMLP